MMGILSARHTHFPLHNCAQGLANVGLCRMQLKPDYTPDWVAGARLKMVMRRALFAHLRAYSRRRRGSGLTWAPGRNGATGATDRSSYCRRSVFVLFQYEYQRYQERAYAR